MYAGGGNAGGGTDVTKWRPSARREGRLVATGAEGTESAVAPARVVMPRPCRQRLKSAGVTWRRSSCRSGTASAAGRACVRARPAIAMRSPYRGLADFERLLSRKPW